MSVHDTEKLRELLARVGKTPAPSRSIDGEIAILLDGYFFEKRGKDRKAWYYPINGRCRRDAEGSGPFSLDRYTASLDASIALVERMLPGWDWLVSLSELGGREFSAVVEHWDGNEYVSHRPTAPLAILSALLRALISQAEGEGQHGPRA